MNKLLKACAIACCVVSIFISSVNSETTSDPGLVGVGARVLALGNAYTALSDDPDAIFTNPAGLAQIREFEMTSMYTQLFDTIDYKQLGFTFPFWRGTAGFGFVGTSIGDIALTKVNKADEDRYMDEDVRPYYERSVSYFDEVYYMAYSFNASEVLKNFELQGDLLLGSSVKYFRKGSDGLSDFAGSGFDLDLGAIYKWSDDLSFGVLYRNALPSLGPLGSVDWGGGVKDEIPELLRLGSTYKMLDQKLIVNADMDFDLGFEKPTLFHVGTEWTPIEMLALRGGLDQKLDPVQGGTSYADANIYTNMTLGIGLSYSGFRFDYAYRGFYQEDANHFFSISYLGEDEEYLWLNKPKTIADFGYIEIDEDLDINAYFPRGNVITAKDEISVIGVARNATTLNINDLVITIGEKQFPFNYLVKLPNIGNNFITIKAQDASGNVTMVKRKVVRLPREVGLEKATVGDLVLSMDAPDINGGGLRRKEFIKNLLNLAEIKPVKNSKQHFKDIKADDPINGYLEAAINKDILKVPGDKKFRPTGRVTWGEALSYVSKIEGIEIDKSKASGSHWSQPYIDAARENNIISDKWNKSPNEVMDADDFYNLIGKTDFGKKKIDNTIDWLYGNEDRISFDNGSVLKSVYRDQIVDEEVLVNNNAVKYREHPVSTVGLQEREKKKNLIVDSLFQNKFHKPLAKLNGKHSKIKDPFSPNRLKNDMGSGGAVSTSSLPTDPGRLVTRGGNPVDNMIGSVRGVDGVVSSGLESPKSFSLDTDAFDSIEAVGEDKKKQLEELFNKHGAVDDIEAADFKQIEDISSEKEYLPGEPSQTKQRNIKVTPLSNSSEFGTKSLRFGSSVAEKPPIAAPESVAPQVEEPILKEAIVSPPKPVEELLSDVPVNELDVDQEIIEVEDGDIFSSGIGEVPGQTIAPQAIEPTPVQSVPKSEVFPGEDLSEISREVSSVELNDAIEPYKSETFPEDESIIASIYVDQEQVQRDLEIIKNLNLEPKVFAAKVEGVTVYEVFVDPKSYTEVPRNVVKKLRKLGFAAYQN